MVYLIHFDRPFHHARHYIGFTENLEQRFHEHAYGDKGAKLLHAVREAGIGFRVVNLWPAGDRSFEREQKNKKNAHRLCPVCNPTLNCYITPDGMVYQPEKEN